MLIRFYASAGKEREEAIAQALKEGAPQFDDRVEVFPTDGFVSADPSVDVACAFGVKGHTKDILDRYKAAGKRTVMFDKALVRAPGAPNSYHRVCIDGTTPLSYMMRRMRTWERWERLGIRVHERRDNPKGAIVFAGSSQKYCAMHGLGNATEYARAVFHAIREQVKKRELVYRPKPSWTGFQKIEGTRLSRGAETLDDLMPDTFVLVTHGSSAAIDAVIAGVPAITLGQCAASPVCGSDISGVREPSFPSDEARLHWLWNAAFCQWKVSEIASGEAWAFIRNELASLPA